MFIPRKNKLLCKTYYNQSCKNWIRKYNTSKGEKNKKLIDKIFTKISEEQYSYAIKQY